MEPLLTPNDPAPVVVVNEDGMAPVVITCDHANNTVPEKLGDLGLSEDVRSRHIGYDIGAKGISEILSLRLDAPAVIAGFSRLVIDINRPVDDFTSIRQISDRTVIPGNLNIDHEDEEARREELYWPFHRTLAKSIAERHENGKIPALIAMHSCTDELYGVYRPWHIGVLSNKDRRLAEKIITILERDHPELCIGDNKPYSGMDPYGYTLEHHAVLNGLPNVLFEVRQDLIKTQEGIEEYATILGDALEEALKDPSLYHRYSQE